MRGCGNIMGGCVSFQIKVQILALYTDVCTDHKGPYTRPYKRPKFDSNFYLETHATTHNIYFIQLRILLRFLVHYTGVWMTLIGWIIKSSQLEQNL